MQFKAASRPSFNFLMQSTAQKDGKVMLESNVHELVFLIFYSLSFRDDLDDVGVGVFLGVELW